MPLPRVLLIALCVLAGALRLGADVSPFPVWSITTDGAIAGAVVDGDRIVLGGSFSRVGRGVRPFEGFLDPLTLALRADPGCARSGSALLGIEADGSPRLIDRGGAPGFPAGMRDGAGPFAVAGDVTHIRVGTDCRFDRHFALRLPPRTGLSGRPLQVGNLLYAGAIHDFFGSPSPYYVVATNAVTGDLHQAWPVPSRVEVVAAAPDGRLAVLTQAGIVGDFSLGFFDPATGQLGAVRSFPGGAYAAAVRLGDRALVSRYDPSLLALRLELCDVATWQPLPGWPEVQSVSEPRALVTVTGRLVIAARGLRIGAGAERGMAVFDATSGAHDTSWTAPDWIDSSIVPSGQIFSAGSRLLVHGDFPAGAPRDTLAALDLATGALDPWEFSFAANGATRAGAVVYLGAISSTRRVGRSHLAAVDATGGELLDWDPIAAVPATERSPVTAIVGDGAYVYAAHGGTVRRYDRASAARDASWRLDLRTAAGGSAWVTGLAAGRDALYVVGDFDLASDSALGPAQARNGGAAIEWSGLLTAWNPRLTATCRVSTRPPRDIPCIRDIALTADRAFLLGQLLFLTPPVPSRGFAAVALDSGALDPGVPAATVFSFAAEDGILWISASLGGQTRLVRVDPGLQPTLLPGLIPDGAGALAARRDRVYAGAEIDAVTAVPTGNRKFWLRPVAAEHGMLDIEYSSALGFYPDLLPAAPGAPTDLVSAVSGDAVTLRWASAATDLQPLVIPPSPGGTAATSYVITASGRPGGPALAQLDTASAETAYEVTAPPGVYFVRVQAKNAFGHSTPSNEVRVEVRPGPPDPPVAVVATVTGQAVRVQWQAAPQGWPTERFVLEAGLRPGSTDLAAVPVSGVEFRAAGLPPGRYYVRLRAVNQHGAGAASDELIVEIRP